MSTNADLTHEGYTPWSPAQVREQHFGQPNRRNDGYRRQDVDPFVERMAQELEWHQARIRDLTHQLEAARIGVEIVGDPYQDVNETALAITMNAQLEADKTIAAAEAHAEQLVADAELWVASSTAEHIDPPPHPDDEAETEQQSAQRVADELPGRIDALARDGEGIVRDAQWLASVAQASLSRVASLTASIAQQLSSEPLTDATSAPPDEVRGRQIHAWRRGEAPHPDDQEFYAHQPPDID